MRSRGHEETKIEFSIDGETYIPPFRNKEQGTRNKEQGTRNKEQDLPLSKGDRLHIESPGGGYGDPPKRDTERAHQYIV